MALYILNLLYLFFNFLNQNFNISICFPDEKNELLAAPFMTLPSKRKVPEFYQRISEPIDLTTIEQNILSGVYRNVEMFDEAMNRLIANSVRFFGRTSELGIAATRLRKVYGQKKLDIVGRLEEVLGEKAPPNFIGNGDPGNFNIRKIIRVSFNK